MEVRSVNKRPTYFIRQNEQGDWCVLQKTTISTFDSNGKLTLSGTHEKDMGSYSYESEAVLRMEILQNGFFEFNDSDKFNLSSNEFNTQIGNINSIKIYISLIDNVHYHVDESKGRYQIYVDSLESKDWKTFRG